MGETDTVTRVKIDDFKDSDGDVDWNAYAKAEIANGQRCYKCESLLIFPKGHEDMCYQCKCITEAPAEELFHDSLVRCPECGHTFNPLDSECYDLFEDGEHEVWCDCCDARYTISTRVSYSFVSPPKKANNDE